MTKKKTKRKKKENNFEAVTPILILILLLLLIFNLAFEINKTSKFSEDNIIIPRNAKGIIYGINGDTAIIKLDINDQRQAFLLKQIENFCEINNIEDCRGFKFP